MRRGPGRAALLLAVLSGVTAACSSAAPSASSAIDPAADRAAARAVNLTSADLAGWQRSAGPSSSSNDPTSKKLAACAGAPDPDTTHVVDVSSDTFDQGPTEVSSDVTTVKTHAQGMAELRAITGPKIQRCIEQVLVPQLEAQLPSGAVVSGFGTALTAAPGSPPDSFGMRIHFSIAVPGQGSVNVVGDLDGVLVGRAELELTIFQSDGAVPDPALEQRLLATLVRRAQRAGF